MRAPTIAVAALLVPQLLSGQDAAPAGLGDIEAARSRACVPVLARVDALNLRLQPLGLRAERLRAVATAIAIEDRAFVDSLDQTDETEAAVHAWFIADMRLAEGYVETQNEELQRQRTVAREGIKGTVQGALEAVQAGARTIMESEPDLSAEAAPCDGAIFLRPEVLAACEGVESPICSAAAPTEPDGVFRFVDSAEDLWDVQEIRPWSPPGPLQVAPDGSLAGARTVAFARHGNIVITVAFAPLIQPRSQIDEEQAAELMAIVDSIGFAFDHPDLVYAPSIAVRATLPEAIAGEDLYVLHFGTADDADIVWTAASNSGAPLEAPVVLQPGHIVRLQNGEPLQMTAVRSTEDGDNEALFTLALTAVNQANATRQLLGYMAGDMVEDLKRLIPPGSGG